MDQDPKLIGEFAKNVRERVRVTRELYKGVPLISIRFWAAYEPDDLRPTKNGFSLKPELIPNLIAALQAAQSN